MKYIKNQQEFLKLFSSSLYDKVVKENVCRSKIHITKREYKEILKELYKELISYEYIPSPIEEKVFIYKSDKVARILPVMNIKDELVYYFACKMIEEEIAINRVEHTFGGWRLGNEIKLQEDAEIDYVYKSYNSYMWRENWKQFQNILNIELNDIDDESLILKLDIANFYDSININLLEKKLLSIIGPDKIEYINILIYLLKNWNIKAEKYNFKSVGIPQNQFGDQSRLLANFYLQGYDIKVKEICDKSDAKYLRYADDQIIILQDKSKLNDILYVISKELNNLGLNLNASKVKEHNRESIRTWYAIPIFQKIDNEEYNEAADLFLDYIDMNKEFNLYSVLKKFINIDMKKISISNRNRIKSILTGYEFLKTGNEYIFIRIYNLLIEDEKEEFINTLLKIAKETTYNGFHYECINFFERIKKNIEAETVKIRLNEIKNI